MVLVTSELTLVVVEVVVEVVIEVVVDVVVDVVEVVEGSELALMELPQPTTRPINASTTNKRLFFIFCPPILSLDKYEF